jgi:hypothetical protein
MVCDAVVLSHLGAEERRDYGGTLIKLVDYISKPPLVPSLIPIINRKHEIERRITMIAQFKPTPRLITLASAALLLALAGFTFTGAAEKEVPQKNPEKPKSESDLAKQRETHERRFRVLEREMDKLNREVRDAQALVDELREKLVITSDAREDSGSSVNAEALRQLERLRIEAQAEYEQMNTLFTHLAKLSRPELRKAIMTASPDPQLSELFNAMAVTEQKLADLSDNHAADHPDVKRMKRVLQTINTQVNDRLDGILEGLKARAASHKAKLERLQAEVEKAKVHDIATAIQRRPYFQAKRDLESLQEVLAALKRRVIQEKIDVEIPKGP